MTDVPEGYKMSEVGVIPEDWEVKEFGEFAYLSKNHINPQHSSKSYPCIELEHLSQETGILLGFVDSKEQLSQKLIFSKGDVLFGKLRPYLKKFYFAEFDGVCTSEMWVIKSYNNSIGQFLFHLVQSNHFLEIANQTSGTKMPRSDWKTVNYEQFPLPSLPEQQAIASALSDMNALITALEQLITKKRNIKQGAMQQLVTGEKRLPGFRGEWGMVPLKNLIQVPVTDGPHLTPKFLQEGIPFLSVNNLVNNRISLSNLRYISKNDHDIFSRKCEPKKEDILLGKAASVGLVAVVDLDFDFNIWSPIALIRLSNQHIPKFIYYSFQSRYVINQIKLFTNSSSQGNIGMGDIEEIDFLVPSKEEQIAIAQILSDMDTEIEALEQKQAKYKAIKQGMMQELLTGKTRLV